MKSLFCVMAAACVCAFLISSPPFAGARSAEEALYCIVSPEGAGYVAPAGVEVWTKFWMGRQEIVVVAAPRSMGGTLAPAGGRCVALDEPGIGEEIFVVASPRGLDVDLISRNAKIQLLGERSALVLAAPSSANLIAEGGMEIRALHAPSLGAPPASAPVPSMKKMSQGADVVQEIVDRITAAAVDDMEKKLSGVSGVTVGGAPYAITTRNSDSGEPIEKATQYGYEYFQAQGLTASYQEYSDMEGGTWRNVYAEQPGTVNPNNVIIICGHLDDMPDDGNAPGADDNASGSAAVLLAASTLKDYTFEHSIIYVLFTGEEQGLYGSAAFVQALAGTGKHVIGALNFDMIAYDGNGDSVVDVNCGTEEASGLLGDAFINTVTQYSLSLIPIKFTDGSATWSDHASFWDAGYAAICGIEDDDDFNPYYHKITDTWAHCNPTYAVNFMKAAAGTLARIALPAGQTQADIVLSGTSFGVGDSFSSQFVLNRSIERAFTAYAVIFLPDGSMVDAMTLGAVAPVASSVPGLAAPFAYPLLSIAVPPGAPQGTYEMVAAFFDPSRPITGRGDAFMEAAKTFTIR